MTDDVGVTPPLENRRITRPFGLSTVRGVDCLRCGWDALAADDEEAAERYARHHCTGMRTDENRT